MKHTKFRNLSLSVFLIGSLALAGTPANASSLLTSTNTLNETQLSVDQPKEYEDGEIVKLLLAGQGLVAKDNPQVVEDLGFDPERPVADPQELQVVVDEYLAYSADFNEIRNTLESGDPRLVESGLVSFTEDFQAFVENEHGLQTDDKTPSAHTQNCDGSACVNVAAVANAAAAVNGAVYANVAGATFAVAAVAVIFVVGPVAYLADPDDPQNEMADFERDIITTSITDVLAA